MGYSHYERLSALDAAFLAIEDSNVHMHVGSIAIFDAAPLRTPGGGLDMERIRDLCIAALHQQPRFRQKLAWVPILNHPVWVDDHSFNLNYHVRHTSLPLPGDVRLLKRLAGRIMSQKLDRGKPLWEMWFIDGVEGDRLAIVSKVHHCMIDGISGVDLMASLMQQSPETTVPPPKRWLPRPVPSGTDLLADELSRRALLPLSILSSSWRALSEPQRALGSLRNGIAAVGEALSAGLTPASATPINPDIGPHRRFDWARFDFDAVKDVKNRLGGTINDVVLACVAGGMRRFLQGRSLRVDDLVFRSMVPVNLRSRGERDRLGNRVSFLMARLPLDEPDPRRRLRKVTQATEELKRSRQVLGAEILEQISDWALDSILVQYARLGARSRAYNMVVTNVPGPRLPVYMLGARMQEVYPLVPLFSNQAIGIALFSYAGSIYWGFNCDWDAVPDLHDLVDDIEAEFALLRQAASAPAPKIAESTGRRPRRRQRPKRMVAQR